MYECIVGYAPFYAEDSVSTCKRIVHWRSNLSFPPEVRLSGSSLSKFQWAEIRPLVLP